MSRQLDQAREARETTRRIKLVKAVEYNLVDALYNQGADLRGLAIRYRETDCLLTLKVDIDGVRHVAFISSDTIMNCIIRADSAAASNSLKWSKDKYFNNNV